MSHNCLVCSRISQIKNNTNPYFVAELETGYVVIGDYQLFEGYTLLLCKEHVAELHNLNQETRLNFLEEMSLVAEAVYHAFKPKKLNYELLGNSEPHLHWHIFPRYAHDPNPEGPTWQVDQEIRFAKGVKPSTEKIIALKRMLLEELDNVAKDKMMKRFGA